MDAQVSQRDVVQALMPFAQPDTKKGLRWFVVDFVVFVVGAAIAVVAQSWWVSLIGSLIAGFKMGSLYTLAHDCAHQTLTASRPLNKVLGVIGYLVGFHNLRLRAYDHLVLGHHPHLNGPQPDAYRPMSLKEYQACSPLRRWAERFFRHPSPLAFAPYCIGIRWVQRESLPPDYLPATARRAAWRHVLGLVGYLGAWLGGLWLLNGGDLGAWGWDVLAALVIPFLLFQTLTSAILFFQHTHPSIRWFASEDSEYKQARPQDLTVHLVTPRWLSDFTHGILDHPAHHVLPAIPCYRLREAQEVLRTIAPREHLRIPLWDWRTHLDTMRRCKLYDYDNHRWLDFDGNSTSGTDAA